MRVTGLRQYLKGILKFSISHEEKVVKEEKSSFDTYLKNVGNFLLKLWEMVVTEMVHDFKM